MFSCLRARSNLYGAVGINGGSPWSTFMLDLIFVAAGAAFFAVAITYAYACERL